VIEDRKAAILCALVEEYIESAVPVGSGRVASHSGIDLSAATVRHELAWLEEEGFLVQPHTSAGRIPTEKAYRFFVDSLGDPGGLETVRREQVREFFARSHREVEQMLRDTSMLLSDLTGSPAVVLAPDRDRQCVRSIQLVGLGTHQALLVVVLANGTVEKQMLKFSSELSELTLGVATEVLTPIVVGSRLGNVPDALPTGNSEVDEVIAAAIGHLIDDTRSLEDVFVGGAARVAGVFDSSLVEQVLHVLERQYVVVRLIRDVLQRGLSVAIGTETRVEPLNECSLVVAPYEINGNEVGSVAVLGPTRMDYTQTLATVAVVSRRLGDCLTEG